MTPSTQILYAPDQVVNRPPRYSRPRRNSPNPTKSLLQKHSTTLPLSTIRTPRTKHLSSPNKSTLPRPLDYKSPQTFPQSPYKFHKPWANQQPASPFLQLGPHPKHNLMEEERLEAPQNPLMGTVTDWKTSWGPLYDGGNWTTTSPFSRNPTNKLPFASTTWKEGTSRIGLMTDRPK